MKKTAKTFWINPKALVRIPDLRIVADENSPFIQAVIDGLKWNVIGANKGLQIGGY